MTPSSATGSSPTSSRPPAIRSASGGSGGCAASSACGRPRRRRAGDGKRPGPAVHDDLVQRNFTAERPDAVWLTDITEHPTARGQALLLRDQGRVLQPDRRLLDRRADDRRSSPSRRCARRSPGASRPAPWWFTATGAANFARRAFRAVLAGAELTGSMGRVVIGRGQRRDGVVLLAAAEERPQPAPLADPQPSSATRSSTGSSTPTTAGAANAASAGSPPSSSNSPSPPADPPTPPRRHDQSQPPSTKVAADPFE